MSDGNNQQVESPETEPGQEYIDLIKGAGEKAQNTLKLGFWWWVTLAVVFGILAYIFVQYRSFSLYLAELFAADKTSWTIFLYPLPALLGVALLTYILGMILGHRLGKRMMRGIEKSMEDTPGIGFLYVTTRAYLRAFKPDNGVQVIVIDPDDHSFQPAQMTAIYRWDSENSRAESLALDSDLDGVGDTMCTVYISASPLPRWGFTRTLHSKFVVPVPWSFGDWLRYTVSLGSLTEFTEPVMTPVLERMIKLGMLKVPKGKPTGPLPLPPGPDR